MACLHVALADSVSEWWQFKFPPAFVILLIFIALGKVFGWLITKVLAAGADDLNLHWRSMVHLQRTELKNLSTWEHVRRGLPLQSYSDEGALREASRPKSGSTSVWANPKGTSKTITKSTKWYNWIPTGIRAGITYVSDGSTSIAAWFIRKIWSGGLSQDAAVVIGHVFSVIIYFVGLLVSLSYAGLEMCVHKPLQHRF